MSEMETDNVIENASVITRNDQVKTIFHHDHRVMAHPAEFAHENPETCYLPVSWIQIDELHSKGKNHSVLGHCEVPVIRLENCGWNSITIYYFAKEESDCKFAPVYAEAFVPVKVPFQKGLGQKFRQPSGTGIDLGFFELDALSKPSSGEDVFPLVICAETTLPLFPTDEHLYDLLPSIATGPHMQITQAVLEKNNGDPFKVRVMRQILWIDGVRYELREIYGIGHSAESFNDTSSGTECVICMTEPKDTAVLPCRHMCLCSECAKALRLQSNKCPICRQPIEELMEIKINTVDR
ncbi:Zinc finger, RING/FYVE/PHD-type [Cynara cardunculus var. scolymus]|uniref:RING-type E3 ubiquitin transferase n=1 Tax=Cynara cardunculus var. scolymus TaxID=59895 RepID=A0A103XMR9_CYNCS|nr:Zinc finger, RING/FYVE/PHD-type [Cynara cardunculus var. scolymus]